MRIRKALLFNLARLRGRYLYHPGSRKSGCLLTASKQPAAFHPLHHGNKRMTKKLAFHLSSVLVSTDYPFFLSCRNLSRSENQTTVPNPPTSSKLLRFYLMSKVCPNSFAVAYPCEWRLCHRLIHRMLTKLTGLLIYLLGPLAMPRKPY